VRALQRPRPRKWSLYQPPRLPGGSAALAAAVRRLEHEDPLFEYCSVAAALKLWRHRATGPARLLTAPDSQCECGCLGPPPRELLEITIHRLPLRTARELREMVEAIDQRYRARTFPNPTAPPGPWWRRRCFTGNIQVPSMG